MKEALDRTEPLTWLKHLFDGRDKKAPRSPWYITALLAEEYVRHHITLPTMSTIPEDAVAPDESPASGTFQDTKSPSSSTWSSTPPHFNLEPSISRKPASYDAQLSFEPLIESGRDSVGPESRASSDGSARNWRMSLGNGASSPRSSVYSGRPHATSPTSSRLHLLEFAKRIRRRPNDSDENLSSARNSISEHDHSEDGQPNAKRAKVEDGLPGLPSHPVDGDAGHEHSNGSNAAKSGENGAATRMEDPDWNLGVNLLTPKPQGLADLSDPRSPSPSHSILNRRPRISLPASPDFATLEQERHRREEDEEREREEYERKAQSVKF